MYIIKIKKLQKQRQQLPIMLKQNWILKERRETKQYCAIYLFLFSELFAKTILSLGFTSSKEWWKLCGSTFKTGLLPCTFFVFCIDFKKGVSYFIFVPSPPCVWFSSSVVIFSFKSRYCDIMIYFRIVQVQLDKFVKDKLIMFLRLLKLQF